MSFQVEIRELYKKVNERNEQFLSRYISSDFAKYNVFKVKESVMWHIEEQNEQFLNEFKEIVSRHEQDIDVTRGFKNRLFVCYRKEDIIVRINTEICKSSKLMTHEDIKELLKHIAEIGYKDEPVIEIDKLEKFHQRMKKEKYRVHILRPGVSFRATIQDNKSFEMYARMNIAKRSGLLLLDKQSIDIIEPSYTIRKPRKDKKNAILSLEVDRHLFQIIE